MSDRELIDCKTAKASGLKKYFTGKPCRRGHIAERLVSCNQCTACTKEVYSVKTEEQKAARAAWFDRNKCRLAAKKKAYAEARSEHLAIYYKQYYLSKREDKIAQSKAYYEANKGSILEKGRRRWRKNIDKHRRRSKEIYAINREAILSKMARWRKANPDKANAGRIRWARLNPEKRKEIVRVNSLRRRATEGTFTKEDIRKIMQMQRSCCAYCREKVGKNFHVDHIVPIAKGGTNWPSNLQITCATCNLKKNDRLPEDFAREMGLLL